VESKYYTPKIEEFNVGFEYEVFQKGIIDGDEVLRFMPIETSDKWYKFKFPDPYVGYRLDILFKQTIRIKYLDKENIESFGFKCDTLSESKFMYGKFADEFSIKIKHNDFFIKYFYADNHLIIAVHNNEMMDSGEESVLFNGVVKNKSELKVILNQVRIINE